MNGYRMRTDDLNDLSRFLGELQAESGRGLALVGTSVLDDKLRATLGSFFIECNAASRLLEIANAPLGTFSALADACFALGLIDQGEHKEISLIRKVRNEFAHGLHGTKLASTVNLLPVTVRVSSHSCPKEPGIRRATHDFDSSTRLCPSSVACTTVRSGSPRNVASPRSG